jgi:heterotetrameric sarcosine oxidase gamma subunit
VVETVLNAEGLTLVRDQPGALIEAAAWPGSETTIDDIVRSALGRTIPNCGRIASQAGLQTVFRIAPQRIWIVTDDSADQAAELLESLRHAEGAVVDLSHSRGRVEIRGAGALDIVDQLTAVVLGDGRLPVGGFAQTHIHDANVLVHQRGEQAIAIYAPATLLESVVDAAKHAATIYLSRDEG